MCVKYIPNNRLLEHNPASWGLPVFETFAKLTKISSIIEIKKLYILISE